MLFFLSPHFLVHVAGFKQVSNLYRDGKGAILSILLSSHFPLSPMQHGTLITSTQFPFYFQPNKACHHIFSCFCIMHFCFCFDGYSLLSNIIIQCAGITFKDMFLRACLVTLSFLFRKLYGQILYYFQFY